VEVVASLSQGSTAAAQCGLFTHKSVPVIFEPPCRITLGKANNFSFSEEILPILWNPYVHCCVHKSLLMVPVLSLILSISHHPILLL